MTPQSLDDLSEDDLERLHDAGLLSEDDFDYIFRTRVSPQDRAVIDAIAFGIAKLIHTPLGQLARETGVHPMSPDWMTGSEVSQTIARSAAQLANTPIDQLAAEAAAHRGAYNKVPGGAPQGNLGLQGARAMIGADGQSYPEIAARAVQSTAAQNPSPIYGYFRTGSQQKIYLFPALDDARGWLTALVHGQQPHDYAAVFASVDLTRPVSGLESFGHANVSGDVTVGQLWPFFLGMPFGAIGGYFLRKWQEENPGRLFPGFPTAASAPNGASSPGALGAAGMTRGALPKTAGDNGIGGPWLDIEPVVGGPWLDVVGQDPDDDDDDDDDGYTVGGPWLDIEPVVGAQVDDRARRRSWPQTRALIQSAINEVVNATSQAPAAAYVWSLDPPTFVPSSNVVLEGTTGVVPFASHAEALDYMRQRIGTPHVALALFDRQSPHWPNPVNWTKSNDPEHASIIAAQAAKVSPTGTRAAGVGADSIGTVLDALRRQARDKAVQLKQKYSWMQNRNVVLVILNDLGYWSTGLYATVNEADDAFAKVTAHPSRFMYAAYFDQDDPTWPYALNEAVGVQATRSSGDWSTSIGAALDDVRSRAQSLAAKRSGNVIGVIHTVKDGLWHAIGFSSTDDADDWLGTATHDPSSFTYAAYYDKNDYSWPHPVNEKIGGSREPSRPGESIRRGVATSGDWWAA